MEKTLQNKVAVITGAGRGMGKTIAETLAAQGAKVVLGARTLSYGEATRNEFLDKGYTATLCQCDTTVREDCRKLIDHAVTEFGGVDILVHCAADIPVGTIDVLPEDDFTRCMTSITTAAFWLTKDAIPHLAKSDAGRIVYISSTAAISSLPGLAHYSAAKAALDAFARGAATELGAKGITVNTVNPGLIASDRMQSHLSPEHQRMISSHLPIARPGTTQEIADLVAYIVSAKAGYMTGANVVIDGGSTLGGSQVTSLMKN